MGSNCSSNSPVPDEPYPPEIQAQVRALQEKSRTSQVASAVTIITSDEQTQPEVLDRQTLDRYLTLERQIQQLESRHILESLKLKQSQLTDLEKTITSLEKHHEECVIQTAKEKKDVDDVRKLSLKNYFIDQATLDATLSKEQEEYLAACNAEEIVRKELEGLKRQSTEVSAEVAVLHADAQQLENVYEEQDSLLAAIFDGEYGSELENSLEAELDWLLVSRQRISVAHYKWCHSVVLLQHANNQLATAVNSWVCLQQMPPADTEQRYNVCTTARNNLVAANQNIAAARQYLGTIRFPYCEPEELDTLTRATRNVYTDMQTVQRHAHALNVYSTTQARASALLQWFQYVIKETIERDLKKARDVANQKAHQLRTERLRLIKEKIKETLGHDVNFDVTNEKAWSHDTEAVLQDMSLVEATKMGPLVMQADPVSVEDNGQAIDDSTMVNNGATHATMPALLPLNELAPPPKTEELFDNIDELKREHDKQKAELEKAKMTDRTRLQQGLQEKLQTRRSRAQRRTSVFIDPQ